MNAITFDELNAALTGTEASKPAPLLLDVRRAKARVSSGRQIPGAVWRDPALWLDWKDEIAPRRQVVLYCAHGQEISQALTTALQVLGAQAVYLEGGFAAWEFAGGACEALAPAG